VSGVLVDTNAHPSEDIHIHRTSWTPALRLGEVSKKNGPEPAAWGCLDVFTQNSVLKCFSIYLSACLSIYLSIVLSIYLSIDRSISILRVPILSSLSSVSILSILPNLSYPIPDLQGLLKNQFLQTFVCLNIETHTHTPCR
jgi:hypothetical protein